MTIENLNPEQSRTPTHARSVAPSEDPLSLTPSEQARVAMENDKRDRNDADFQAPTPRKRTAKEGGETSGSAKRSKKGKGRAIEMPAHASSSRTPSNDLYEAQRRLDLIGGITEIWKSSYSEWPTCGFAPPAARGNKRLEPDHWSLTLLERVHSLSMIRPDERPEVISRALGQAIAERNNGVAATAEGNAMTIRDIDAAMEKLKDEIWLVTEFRDTRSPTFVPRPMFTRHQEQFETTTSDDADIVEGLLQSMNDRTTHAGPVESSMIGGTADSTPFSLSATDEDKFEGHIRSFMDMASQYLQHKEQVQRSRAAFEREKLELDQRKARIKHVLDQLRTTTQGRDS